MTVYKETRVPSKKVGIYARVRYYLDFGLKRVLNVGEYEIGSSERDCFFKDMEFDSSSVFKKAPFSDIPKKYYRRLVKHILSEIIE